MAWNGRPMLGEDGSAVGVDFTEGNGSHPSSFKSKAESPDPAE
jgi:hypothetical protein